MKKIYYSGFIAILSLFALFGCGGGDGAAAVPPTRADVFVAFDQPVTDLGALDFTLNNSAGATFDNATQPIAAVYDSQGSFSLALGNFDPATNSNRIVLITGAEAGINTGTSPIIRVTYAITPGAGTPSFEIASQATFSAIAPNSGPTTPAVTAANLKLTVTYSAE